MYVAAEGIKRDKSTEKSRGFSGREVLAWDYSTLSEALASTTKNLG
jgi:hypothetical protein